MSLTRKSPKPLPYTLDDDAKILKMVAEKKSYFDIALELKRSYASVYQRAQKLKTSGARAQVLQAQPENLDVNMGAKSFYLNGRIELRIPDGISITADERKAIKGFMSAWLSQFDPDTQRYVTGGSLVPTHQSIDGSELQRQRRNEYARNFRNVVRKRRQGQEASGDAEEV